MNESGIYWIGAALLIFACFPAVIYGFFSLVVLDRKSQGLIDDLNSSKAFEIQQVKQQFSSAADVKATMRMRYGYKRFTWPVLLLILFNLLGFSILWDILRHHFATVEGGLTLLYTPKFLSAAELPMMAFLGVVVLNYGHMLRRLYVWDVTTQVFWMALQRTWLVLAVASVLAASLSLSGEPTGGNSGVVLRSHAIFFIIGFIVNETIRWLMEQTRTRLQIQRMKVEELPLSLIQGINFWHECRLEEEGVENVQTLATCDLLDLAMATRYNLRTLLDWVDQAILIHRMGQKASKLREDGFITGAIDMAWAAPQNNQGDARLAEQVAKTVGVETIYIATLMNSLFQDTQLHMLWDMWQSKLDSKGNGNNPLGPIRGRGHENESE